MVFRGLAGLLRGISRGRSSREIPRSSPTSPGNTLSFPTLLLRFIFYFWYISVLALIKCTNGSILAFPKTTDGSVLAFLKSSGYHQLPRIPQSVNSGVPRLFEIERLLCSLSHNTEHRRRTNLFNGDFLESDTTLLFYWSPLLQTFIECPEIWHRCPYAESWCASWGYVCS